MQADALNRNAMTCLSRNPIYFQDENKDGIGSNRQRRTYNESNALVLGSTNVENINF